MWRRLKDAFVTPVRSLFGRASIMAVLYLCLLASLLFFTYVLMYVSTRLELQEPFASMSWFYKRFLALFLASAALDLAVYFIPSVARALGGVANIRFLAVAFVAIVAAPIIVNYTTNALIFPQKQEAVWHDIRTLVALAQNATFAILFLLFGRLSAVFLGPRNNGR